MAIINMTFMLNYDLWKIYGYHTVESLPLLKDRLEQTVASITTVQQGVLYMHGPQRKV